MIIEPRLYEIGINQDVIYYNDSLDDDDKVTLHINNKVIPMNRSTLGSGYYECKYKPTTITKYLAQIFVNDDKDEEFVMQVIVSKPENQFRMIRGNYE
jgi:hypothetical protein